MSADTFKNNEFNTTPGHEHKNAALEILIDLHYQLSDMNHRLNGFEFDFLQQILSLSELEVRRQMSTT